MTRRSACLALFLLMAAQVWTTDAHASNASLRTSISVRGQMVRLSDLFADLQPGQDCDIGPSPEPGKRIVIPPSQLAAIASEFGVDWQPGVSYQSATLERLGKVITRQEVLAVLRPALVSDGADAASDFSLSAFVSPTLPVDNAATPQIQALDLDPRTGRFSAVLLLLNPGADGMTLRVAGRAEQRVDVVTTTHALPAGSILLSGDLQVLRVGLGSLRGAPVTGMAEVQGMALRRPVAAGMPLLRDMLVRPILIERGRPVVLRLQDAGLQLTAAGTALEAGAAGERIHVMNSLSHAILVGQITAAAAVQIDPGTAPVVGQAIAGENGLPKIPDQAAARGLGPANYAQEAQDR